MSRSIWAWTDGRAPVGVARAALASGWARGSSMPRARIPARRGLFHETPSRLMAASVFVIGVAPAPALAGVRERLARQVPTTDKQYSDRCRRRQRCGIGVGKRLLKPGRCGACADAAASLAGAGFAFGPIDGRYGPRTEQAVRRFQTAHGLEVDGIAGPLTLAALRKPSVALYPGLGLRGTRLSACARAAASLGRGGFRARADRWSLWPADRAGSQAVPARASSCCRRDRRRADPARARQPTPEGVKPTAPHGARAAAPRGSKATSAHQPDRPEAADGSGTAGRARVFFVAEVGDPGRVDRDRGRGLAPGRTRSPTKASDSRGREGGTRGWRCPVGSRSCGTDRGGRGCGLSGIQGRCRTGACTAGGDKRAFARAGDTRAGTRGRTTGAR